MIFQHNNKVLSQSSKIWKPIICTVYYLCYILFRWLLDAKNSGGRQLVVFIFNFQNDIIGPCIRDLSLGSQPTYVEKKEIPDLSTQQQSTGSILVNSESLLFVDLCYGFWFYFSGC